jgi:hypothetical protein
VVARDEAVFWLDGQGYWCNRHGRFRNVKISNHFHASIQKDEQGYYLTQVHPDYLEKVYFPCRDTALFVFQVQAGNPITLVLNTGQRIPLDPEELFTANDALYVFHQGERIKFSERALIQLSRHLEFKGDEVFFNLEGQRVQIPDSPQAAPDGGSSQFHDEEPLNHANSPPESRGAAR